MLQLLQVVHQPSRLRVVTVELQTELTGLRQHVAASRKLGYEHARLVANQRRVDVLVGVLVPEHRGHVLPALVRERDLTDERLLQRQREVGDLGHSARELAELLDRCLGKGVQPELQHEVGDHGHEVRVAASLAVAVDGSLHHLSAGDHACKRVGNGELAVVVRVDAHARLAADAGQRRADRLHAFLDRIGLAAAVGVAKDDPRCAGACRR